MKRTARTDNEPDPARIRPRMFVGCSSEGLDIARAIQSALYYDAEPVLWSDGVFGLSGGTLETLMHSLAEFDFAVFVLTADDLLERRGRVGNAPRDNVLFELGLFMGRLGRERTFFVICRDDVLHMPTDLAGVTPALFLPPSEPRYLQSALAVATTPILASVRILGRRGEAQSPTTALSDELDRLRRQVREMRIILADLATHATRPGLLPAPALDQGAQHGLGFLQGVWVGDPTGSTAWCAVEGEEATFAYCYRGSGPPTGIYYDWTRTGSTITARFRWLDDVHIYGYAWFEIQAEQNLVGGWWMGSRLGPGQEQKLPHVDGMVPLSWKKESDTIPRGMEKEIAYLAATHRKGEARRILRR